MVTRNIRKWTGLICAIVLYYVVHEGAHCVVALVLGTFEGIRFARWGLGVQILADTAHMTDIQIFVFGTAGVVLTLIAGYLLVGVRRSLLRMRGKYPRAVAYYATLVFLCLDPLYLSILFRFVGGGDMNSIVLVGIPEVAASVFFFLLLVVNVVIFAKLVYPAYRGRFLEDTE